MAKVKNKKQNWDSKKWKAYFTESVWFEGKKTNVKLSKSFQAERHFSILCSSEWNCVPLLTHITLCLAFKATSGHGLSSKVRICPGQTLEQQGNILKAFTLHHVSWLGLLWTQESIKYCLDNNSLQVLPMVSHYNHLVLVKCQSMAPSFLSYIYIKKNYRKPYHASLQATLST